MALLLPPTAGNVMLPPAIPHFVDQQLGGGGGGSNKTVVVPYRPHADTTLTFDFEPAIEEDAVTLEAKRTRQKRMQDPRYKTVVCMHWISGLCMKQEKCEFLHEFDPDRMPDCKNNERCTDKMCYFKHLRADERALCNNYKYGFCPHGASCKYQHRKKNADELPEVSEYVQPIFNLTGAGGERQQLSSSAVNTILSGTNITSSTDDGLSSTNADGTPSTTFVPRHFDPRNNPQTRNPNYRTALCNSIQNGGVCQYGESCNYAHSREEMEEHIRFRATMSSSFPAPLVGGGVVGSAIGGGAGGGVGGGGDVVGVPGNPPLRKLQVYPLDRYVADLRSWGDDLANGMDSMAPRIDSQYKDRPLHLVAPGLPPMEVGKARFFICRTDNFSNLAASLKYGAWVIHPSLGETFNVAFHEVEHVYLCFAVDPDSGEEPAFAGLARMRSEFQVVADERVERMSDGEAPLTCKVEWLRTCELQAKKTAFLTSVVPIVARELPIYMCIEGAELPPSIGRALVSMLYLEPNNPLSKEQLDGFVDLRLIAHNLGPWQSLNVAFEASPLPPPEIGPINIPHLNIQVGQYAIRVRRQGYVLHVANEVAFTEMMQRSMLGAPFEEKTDMEKVISPGTIMLVYCSFDGKVYGVFEAISGTELLWEPSAFKGHDLPLHVKFRPVIHCGHIHENAFTPFKREKGILPAFDLQQLINFMAFRARKPQFKPANPLRSEALEVLYEGGTLPIEYPPGIHWNEPQQMQNGSWRQTCTINIEFNPKFKAPHKLIGKGGLHMKEIKEQSGATQARVMAGEEEPAPGIIEMVFEAPNKPSVEYAGKLGQIKLDELMADWEVYQENGRQMTRQRMMMMMAAQQQAMGVQQQQQQEAPAMMQPGFGEQQAQPSAQGSVPPVNNGAFAGMKSTPIAPASAPNPPNQPPLPNARFQPPMMMRGPMVRPGMPFPRPPFVPRGGFMPRGQPPQQPQQQNMTAPPQSDSSSSLSHRGPMMTPSSSNANMGGQRGPVGPSSGGPSNMPPRGGFRGPPRGFVPTEGRDRKRTRSQDRAQPPPPRPSQQQQHPGNRR